MVDLDCKDCIFSNSCDCIKLCSGYTAYGIIEEELLHKEIEYNRYEFYDAWYAYVSEFDDDFSF